MVLAARWLVMARRRLVQIRIAVWATLICISQDLNKYLVWPPAPDSSC